uniref:Gag-Pol polyprotein n=1 Tax=Tanacetum cinerariifolium TaxID=118510 RepID=A0A6L2N097_TANCI|nr:Gag-Pol polyprotein [Tanacetum cinerariifolium]
MKCYNYQREGHMARQCIQPQRPRNSAWFKEKLMLFEAQEAGQTEDLDAYDLDCDYISSAKEVLTTNKIVNESLTAELERYKERVAIFKQRQNVDLKKGEKLIDSQMDDLIQNRNAKLATFQQEIDTLKETLSNNVKEKDSLSTTLNVFKTEFKEKESMYIDKEIVLEKQNKEPENIICKFYQSTQAMHMLTKPQFFYDDTHKQAIGYQNPFYLKKAQRIKPTLYDGSVISKEHAVIFVIDDDETDYGRRESIKDA